MYAFVLPPLNGGFIAIENPFHDMAVFTMNTLHKPKNFALCNMFVTIHTHTDWRQHQPNTQFR